MSRFVSVWTLAMCAWLLFPFAAQGMIYSKTIKLSGADSHPFFVFQRFGLLSGGTLNITMQLSSNSTGHFGFCSDEEVDVINASYSSVEELCDDFVNVNCAFKMSFNEKYLDGYIQVTKKDTYNLFTENCNEETITIKTKYTLLNPGGQHLDFGLIPLLDVYKRSLIGVSVLALLWLTNRMYNRKEPGINLHRFITFLLILKILKTTFSDYHWEYISENGVEPEWLKYLDAFIVQVGYDFTFYSVIMLISKGYCITTDEFDIKSNAISLLILVILSLSFSFFSIFGSTFIFPMTISYFLFFRTVIVSNTFLNTSLQQQMDFLQITNFQGSWRPLLQKRTLLRLSKFTWICLVLSNILGSVTGYFLEHAVMWFPYFTGELVEASVLIPIAYIFRLKDSRDFNYQENFANMVRVLQRAEVTLGGDDEFELRPMPDGAEYFTEEQLSQILVIQMPDERHEKFFLARRRDADGEWLQSEFTNSPAPSSAVLAEHPDAHNEPDSRTLL